MSQALRILIVDDNVDAAVTMAELLRMLGHEVHTFHDGPSALEAVRGIDPSVALLDLGMPGMHGFELASRLRTLSPSTLLVACTGWGSEKDVERGRRAGFHHHLVKPVGLDALEAIFGELPGGVAPPA